MKWALREPLTSEVIPTLGGLHFGYWDSMKVEWGVYKHESMLGHRLCECVCVGVLALVYGEPYPKCFPRQISHPF